MEQIGRYKIIEKIGFGGMATVYKAHDPQIARTLAIKVLREERCVDDQYRSRFLREAKAVGTLSHPNIVTVYDVGELKNTPYIAMELLNGQTMAQLMKSEGKIELQKILDWGIQLSDALEYAHKQGIIHRDIKPSNIILLDDNKTIKITDFGIAHLEEADVTQHTQLGEVLGTPQYMSPEQVLGKSADARSDLFSVGVILYQLLTGQKPFQADTLATLLFQIATENPEPIAQLAPQLPNSLKQAIDKLLKKKPEKRFQTGAELKHALIRIREDLTDSEQNQNNTALASIKVKWTLLMATVVAVTLTLCSVFLYKQQHQMLQDQLYNYGTSMSKFIASENAETVLSEDWAQIELFSHDTMQNQKFEHLYILDHTHIVRGSGNADLISTSFEAKGKIIQSHEFSEVTVQHQIIHKQEVLNFLAPIYFQNTKIGEIHLGLSKQALQALDEKTFFALSIIILATLIAVSSVVFIIGKQTSNALSTLKKAMNEITQKHFSYRIGLEENNEFGQTFKRFDEMAQKLQKSVDSGKEHDKS